MPLSDFCVEHQIELVALYPNATHIIQPMDVAVFRPLKSSYRKAVKDWQANNNYQDLSRYHIAEVLKAAIDGINMERILKSGFKGCGLCPFNVEAVDFTKLFSREGIIEESTAASLQCTVNICFIEKNIDPTILLCFKSNYGTEWTGPLKYKELYNFWIKVVESCDHCIVEIENYKQCEDNPEEPTNIILPGSTPVNEMNIDSKNHGKSMNFNISIVTEG